MESEPELPSAAQSAVARARAVPNPDSARLKVPRTSRRFVLLLAALGAIGPFSVDTYFPSFASIAAHFSVTPLQVQSTLSFYLAALAGMNLFHGAVSDAFGRKPTLLVSLAVYSATAFACLLAPNFACLLTLRVVQGLAAGAGMIVGRAVIRDCRQGAEAQRLMAQVTMAGAVAPAIAPVLGGWLHNWFGWRGPFCFLGLSGLALMLACWFWLGESLPRASRQSFRPGKLLRSYCETGRNASFLALCFSLSIGAGGFLLYVATAPDVVLNILKLSETQFGWFFVPMVSGMMLGSIITGWMAGRVDPGRTVRCGYRLMALGAAGNLAMNLCLTPRIPWAVLPIAIYTLGFSLTAPVLTLLALDLYPHKRGLASSLQGFAQIIVFAFLASAGVPLVYASGIKHAAGMGLLLAGSWGLWRFYRRRPAAGRERGHSSPPES